MFSAERSAVEAIGKSDVSLLALGDLHGCDCLPFVHGDIPCILDSPAAKVNDQLGSVIVKGSEDAL